MERNFDQLPNDIYDPSTELPAEYLVQMDAELTQYYWDQEAAAPVLDPSHTALFSGQIDANMTIRELQSRIREEYAWCREHDVDSFLLDCSSPYGLLALETLSEARTTALPAQLLAFQSTVPSKRESYRSPKESEIEFILLLRKADYLYRLPFDARSARPVVDCAEFFCNAKSVAPSE